MPKVVREYKDQARHRIIEAAVQVLHRKGLAGITMDEIAREIGVSKGALYLYFPSKAQLLEAILSRFRDEMMAKLERSVEEGDVAEGIAGTIDKIFSGEFNPVVWHQVIADSADDPEIREALREDAKRDSKLLQEFLHRMELRGRIPPQGDLEAVADVIYLALGGTIVQVSTRGDVAESRKRLVRVLRWILGVSPIGRGGSPPAPSRTTRRPAPRARPGRARRRTGVGYK